MRCCAACNFSVLHSHLEHPGIRELAQRPNGLNSLLKLLKEKCDDTTALVKMSKKGGDTQS